MYTQSTGPCDDCRGKGEVIDEKNKCKNCQGKKVVKEKKIIDAEIDKGAPTNNIPSTVRLMSIQVLNLVMW